MKKKEIKKLSLSKKVISKLNEAKILGGSGGVISMSACEHCAPGYSHNNCYPGYSAIC